MADYYEANDDDRLEPEPGELIGHLIVTPETLGRLQAEHWGGIWVHAFLGAFLGGATLMGLVLLCWWFWGG